MKKYKEEIKYLKTLGFYEEHLSDNSGYWMQKNLNHYILGNVEIYIQDFEDKLDLSFSIVQNKEYVGDISGKIYTRENLEELLDFLK